MNLRQIWFVEIGDVKDCASLAKIAEKHGGKYVPEPNYEKP